MIGKRDLVLLSGGIDSTVLAYKLHNEGSQVRGIYINTGFHAKNAELNCAKYHADRLDIHLEIVEAPGLASLVCGFYPTEYIGEFDWDKSEPLDPVPDPQEKSSANDYSDIDYVTGVHVLVSLGSFYGLLTKIPRFNIGIIKEQVEMSEGLLEFFDKWNDAIRPLNKTRNCELQAPFKNFSKAEIIRLGLELNVDLRRTWSCYRDRSIHCGECGGCSSRIASFAESGKEDPTRYRSI